MTGRVIRASKQTAVRYERARPGELVHIDVKKLGRIPDGGGWRAHGRAAGDTAAHKRARIGFDYVHSMIDDHSRLAYSEIHPDEKGATCAGFLTRAAAYFAAHGITRIERVMTDNHFSYRLSNDFQTVLRGLGAKHVLIRPHCPWQNGKVERLNRVLCKPNGPTGRSSPLTPPAPTPSHPSSSITTLIATTPPSTAHPSAECYQRDCRVQLAAGLATAAQAAGPVPWPTWPQEKPVPAFTAIDHVLARGAVPTGWDSAYIEGSDHRAVIANWALCDLT